MRYFSKTRLAVRVSYALSLRMDEYFESNSQSIDKTYISVEESSIIPKALQLSWAALTAAFISIVILVICILYSSSKKKIVDIEKQVSLDDSFWLSLIVNCYFISEFCIYYNR